VHSYARSRDSGEILKCQLARDLEDESQVPRGNSLAALAQQYEDYKDFGPTTLRGKAERVFRSRTYSPSGVHRQLASLPFSLIMTTCHDALLTQALRNAGKTPISQRYHLRGDKRDNPEFVLPAGGLPSVWRR
jgi:hypothetical protein